MNKYRRLLESHSPLETLRIEKTSLTQEEFVKRCGIPRKTYHRWVTGETPAKLTPKQMKSICEVLGISIHEMPDDFSKK
jgi:transcriptional regulator with XRE-family HTH domain